MVTKMAAPYRELLHVMLYYYPLEGANVKIGCHLLIFGPKILANTPYSRYTVTDGTYTWSTTDTVKNGFSESRENELDLVDSRLLEARTAMSHFYPVVSLRIPSETAAANDQTAGG